MWKENECFKWHYSLFLTSRLYRSISLSPPLPPTSSPCPSVMALVHPHVYLCYKAEESDRLKMKTQTRTCLCVHFVNMFTMCECEYALFYSFQILASFLYSRVEFLSTPPLTALLFSQPPYPSYLLPMFQPQTGGCFRLVGQVSAIDETRHSNLK